MNNEILIYEGEGKTIEVQLDTYADTVWLNRLQLAELFDRDVKTIGKHVNNVFREGELEETSTVAKFATVQTEGERQVAHYNLDILASYMLAFVAISSYFFKEHFQAFIKILAAT